MSVKSIAYTATIVLSIVTASVANAHSDNSIFATMPSTDKEGFPVSTITAHTHQNDDNIFATMPLNHKEGFPIAETKKHYNTFTQHEAVHDNFMSGSGPNGHVMNGELK
jgi:hypothetical protein